jgi:hypothetical protein
MNFRVSNKLKSTKLLIVGNLAYHQKVVSKLFQFQSKQSQQKCEKEICVQDKNWGLARFLAVKTLDVFS